MHTDTHSLTAPLPPALAAQVNLPRGFAYVEYATKEEAEAARDHMDAAQVDGNVIS